MSQEENEQKAESNLKRGFRRKSSFWARKRRKSTKTVIKTKKEKALREAEDRYNHSTRLEPEPKRNS